ncbi:BAG family molecular chaperone regulator 1B [Pleurostoma richardsiae]|uniref:BAG family molecular chaperone regulator 1B n=1 Tax=Pleurostoma richardsiae TaxID=41990 RepID=A0AA38RM80_9PEZI|nr:BAG family molecular chaperone regulator 1B [Pleurostoma richardsiae]
MSRYGWSSGRERGGLSPFNSNIGDGRGGIPAVTDEDYSYITSEDLEHHGVESSREYGDRSLREQRPGSNYVSRTAGPNLVIDEDDILLIKNRGITYPEHFPAYSIGDGKLLVGDVKDRVQLVMKLSDRKIKQVKLLYKGRQLKDDNETVRSYNVKNNSEIMVVLPEMEDESSEGSEEEVVVVGNDREEDASRKKSKSKKRRGKRKGQSHGSSSPPDSAFSASLAVPGSEKQGASTNRGPSPISDVPGAGVAAAAGPPGGPIDKLNSIASHFNTNLLPLCEQFMASPPRDSKKREDEHRRLAETVMQQVLLKLDEVDSGGQEEARAKRKELVRQVQEVLKGLDGRLHG